MAFFGGVIYIWGQIMLSYAIVPTMTPLWLNHLRVAMNALATGALALRKLIRILQGAIYRHGL